MNQADEEGVRPQSTNQADGEGVRPQSTNQVDGVVWPLQSTDQVGERNGRARAVERLIALWAFSEASLGGLVHALQIPFTGFIVASCAVVLISLIASFAEADRRLHTLLRATAVVLLVKAAASPHTPLPAYLAVAFQGVVGGLVFASFGVRAVPTILFGVLALWYGAVQKLLVATLLYGAPLWESVDRLVDGLAQQLGWIGPGEGVNGALWLLLPYGAYYTVTGLLTGWLAFTVPGELRAAMASTTVFPPMEGPLPPRLTEALPPPLTEALPPRLTEALPPRLTEALPPPLTEALSPPLKEDDGCHDVPKPRRRSRVFRFAGIALLAGLIVVVLELSGKEGSGVRAGVYVVLRVVVALVMWFGVAAPIVRFGLRRLQSRWGGRYQQDVEQVLRLIPVWREVGARAWQASAGRRGIKRVRRFMVLMISAVLTEA